MNDSGIASGGGRTPPHHGLTLTRLTVADPLADPSSCSDDNTNNNEGDLETFREALALSGIKLSLLLLYNVFA